MGNKRNQKKRLSVLVATSDEFIRDRVVEALEGKQFQTVVVDNCEHALEYLLDHDFEAVIFDPSLKELHGSDAVKLIKKLCPELPLVVLADESSYETSVKIATAGVYFRLFKPIDDEIIKELIESLEQRALNSQSNP